MIDIEQFVYAAQQGNQSALEDLIQAIQHKIYGLALRMLYNPQDAEDATQEILIKIVTHLGTFKGESAFSTWMYRVATNHLLTTQKRQPEASDMSFEEYEESLELSTARAWKAAQPDILQDIFVEEVRVSCLQGLLLCLDRPHRLAFLLVDVFDVTSEEGAAILEITPAAFRKRLSRARQRIGDFLTRNCMLVHDQNPCKCGYHVETQINTDRFADHNLMFAGSPHRLEPTHQASDLVQEMDELSYIGVLYRHNPHFQTPPVFLENIRRLLRSDHFQLLRQDETNS